MSKKERKQRIKMSIITAIVCIGCIVTTVAAAIGVCDVIIPDKSNRIEAAEISTPASAVPYVDPYSPEVIALSKTVWGEARGCSKMEQAAIVWCVLNRVDKGSAAGFRNTIMGCLTQPYQFYYRTNFPVWESIREVVVDVLNRWYREKAGEMNVGRVLPKEYMWYYGDGRHNHFQTSYRGRVRWNWSLPNPYVG